MLEQASLFNGCEQREVNRKSFAGNAIFGLSPATKKLRYGRPD
jgi:hypothetical protein